MRNVADTGLQILYQLLQNISTHEHAASSFYQTYYTDILQHIFSVVTDSSHTAGEYQTEEKNTDDNTLIVSTKGQMRWQKLLTTTHD